MSENTTTSARPQGGPPGMGMRPVGQANNFGQSIKRLIGCLRPERFAVAGALLVCVISAIFSMLGPKILGQATNELLAGIMGENLSSGMTKEQAVAAAQESNAQTAELLNSLDFTPGQGINFSKISSILIVVLALYLASAVFSFVQGWILNGVIQRTVYTMRRDVQAKIDSLPLSYFDTQSRGDILSRVTNDIDNISQTLQQTLMQMFSSVLTVLTSLVMMFWISPILGLVALITLPIGAIVIAVIGRHSQKLFTKTWAATGEVNGYVEETYSGHELVKVFGQQKESAEEFNQRNGRLYSASFKSQALSSAIMPIMSFVSNLNYVVIAIFGGMRVASGTMSIGDVQAFIQYARQFAQPVGQIASMANMWQSGVASAERVFEFLDAPEMSPEPDTTGKPVLPEKVEGAIAFEHVDFSYSVDKPLIKDLNMTVAPGQTVAIVGPTGAGKTTLVNLLMRFYDVRGGRITMDGIDIASVPRQMVRDKIGMVLQDTWLFGGTIRENIAYGREDASESEIIEAAKAAFVDRFVHALPEGYDTIIDDEGSNVSAGEKQLITIARAFLSDPSVLILDEATSSVDTRTEVLLQRAMSRLRSGRTSFVIAHRLSTIRDADVIVVMDNGSIVEQGTSEELLAAHGRYWELYQAQFAGISEGSEGEE